jgi:hypothetical protein
MIFANIEQDVFYSIESESLIMEARSERIGSAFGQIRSRCQQKSNPETRTLIALQLKANTGESKFIYELRRS